jgi:acetylornithine deacetylase/succinyl-diaminopimelate desuccinylase-like protein
MEIKGKSVHSARKHLGINAIEEYVHFMDALEKYMQTKDIEGYVSLTNLAGMS